MLADEDGSCSCLVIDVHGPDMMFGGNNNFDFESCARSCHVCDHEQVSENRWLFSEG
jgi:hypothetical protein